MLMSKVNVWKRKYMYDGSLKTLWLVAVKLGRGSPDIYTFDNQDDAIVCKEYWEGR